MILGTITSLILRLTKFSEAIIQTSLKLSIEIIMISLLLPLLKRNLIIPKAMGTLIPLNAMMLP
jgi:hypothetical protein